MNNWIAFEPREPSASGKTKRWAVVPALGGESLGIVAWYAPWRKYCFHPGGNTVFEQDCLRDIATFCAERTTEHKSVPQKGVNDGR